MPDALRGRRRKEAVRLASMPNERPQRDRLLRKLLEMRKLRRSMSGAAAGEAPAAYANPQHAGWIQSLLGSELFDAVDVWRRAQPGTMTMEQTLQLLVRRGLDR